MRAAYCLLALAAVRLSALAQEPPPDPKGTGSIAGAVMDARTRAPVPDARIQLSGPPISASPITVSGLRISAPPFSRSTPADSEGRFLFWDLPPGFYRITASTSGGSWQLAHKSVNLADGENAEIELRAEAVGTISGRVIDQDGKPVAGMTVTMMRSAYSNGVLDNRGEDKATTEEDGTFVLTGVAPGVAHTLRADRVLPMLFEPVSKEPASPEERAPVPEAAWYPDVTSGPLAQMIVLYSGEDRKDVEIRVRRLPGRCVEGVIEDVNGPASMEFDSPAGRGVTGEDGRFRLCGVPRGESRIAVQRTGERPIWGAVTIPSGDKDVSGLKLIATSTATATLHGVVELEDGSAQGKLEGSLTVMIATATGPNSFATGAFYGGTAKSTIPGTFSIPNLIPGGDYLASAGGAPEGYVVNRKTAQGTVSRTTRFHFGGGSDELRLVVERWKGGILSVAVTGSDGKPVLDAWVVAFPAAADSASALSAGMKICIPGQDGSCRMPVEAGKYLILAAATPIAIPTDRETIARLLRARSKAKAVEISSGGAVQVTLTVTELE